MAYREEHINPFKRIKCLLGFHEPMKFTMVIPYRKEFKEFQKCRNCGRRLEPKEKT